MYYSMIITRTPFRISFVGGGSDLRSFYSEHPGAVLSTSINKYMYISSHRFFDENKIQVKYSKTETVTDKREIQHPILRAIFQKFGTDGLELSSIADIASGTGMGSSSAFTVGVLHNLYSREEKLISKEQLAKEACEVEIDLLKEPIGKQDQYAAACGGLNIIRFLEDGKVGIEPLFLKKETLTRLEENLLLLYLGNQRKASSILEEQNENTKQTSKFKALKQMVDLVPELKNAMSSGDLSQFGKLLHENWCIKKSLVSNISSKDIDLAYDLALKHGASGGKVLGAGGGGFFLFYCEKEKQPHVIKALKLRPFSFKFENEGTKLIYRGDE